MNEIGSVRVDCDVVGVLSNCSCLIWCLNEFYFVVERSEGINDWMDVLNKSEIGECCFDCDVSV